MKKNLIILLSALVLFSCSKNESSISNANNNLMKTRQIESDSIGIIHNEGLDYIIERYDYSSSNIDSIFNNVNALQKRFFSSKGYEQENISYELKSLISTGNGVIWLNKLYEDEKIDISLNLKGYLVDILTYTYNGINNPFSQINYCSYLDSVYSNASVSLSTTEMELLEAHIAVAKSSFEYWFNNDGTPRMIFTSSSRTPINWWQTLGADCIGGVFGSACGFLGASVFDVYYQTL